MARIRTIKPEFFRHGGLFDAEIETGLPLRVAFAGLWSACDREGRFMWRPRQLKLDALPFDQVDFAQVLDALRAGGHVVRYTVNGVDYGCIPSWKRHQVINNRETESILPLPCELSLAAGSVTRAARVADTTPTPLVHAEAEGNGKEGKGTEKKPSASSAASPTIPCHYQSIVDLYHDKLPDLPRIKLMTDARQRALRKVWTWVLRSTKPNGERRGRIQPINATASLNISAGVLKPSVLRGLSFNCLAIALS
jgi:hypothetical protein